MRLLLVEDEPDLAAGVARALRKEGYAVDVASDGEEGAYKALGIPYDIIVLDVMLPKVDGWEILSRIREQSSTPVLMLTARDATADRVKGLDGGADDYLVKPFDVRELLARLRALSRRSTIRQERPEKFLEVGNVCLDTASRTVLLGGENVGVTAREYAMLVYLMQRRGQVVTRTELYDHLFDEEDNTLSNLIDVHIFNLRKKLGHGFIATRRGQGYVVE